MEDSKKKLFRKIDETCKQFIEETEDFDKDIENIALLRDEITSKTDIEIAPLLIDYAIGKCVRLRNEELRGIRRHETPSKNSLG